MSTGPAPEPLLTFPPFPPIMEGHFLVPFKDFKPSGIQMFSGEGDGDMEFDGLGIATVELRVKHDTDEPKTGTGRRKGKKKKKKKIAEIVDGEPVRKLTWWEEWEEGEELRKFEYSPAMPRVDCLFKASQDFTESRRWPGLTAGVRNFWDQYRIFLGLLVIQVFRKPKTVINGNKRPADVALYEDNASLDSKVTEEMPSKKTGRSALGDDDLDDDDDDEEEETLAKNALESEEFREDRLIAFLNDPEKAIQIFLSSYMREKGLIWSDRNLVIAPRLTTFFINFLIRNKVFPESHHERSLKRALDLAALAIKELPLTAKIGQALPDDLSMGLKDCFGQMSGGSFLLNGVALKEWGKWDDREKDETGRESKRQKVDTDEKDEDEKPEEVEVEQEKVSEDFEAELKAANIEVIPTHALPKIEKEIVDDNIGMDVDFGSGPSWNCPDKQWMESENEWGKAPDAGAGADGASGAWGVACAAQENPWNFKKPCLLMKFLGPTALPLTHMTGIVEQSTRRIKSVIPPPPIPAKSTACAGGGEDPEAVEEELEKLFAKVVLEPWVGEEGSDIRKPLIRASSKGTVLPGSLMEDGTKVEGEAPTPEMKGTMHNPLESEITLLLEPASAELMSPGMGLLATWVQIVRREEKQKSKSSEPSEAKSKKKKRGKRSFKRYWYMEELLVTFPSFYTQEKLIQIT